MGLIVAPIEIPLLKVMVLVLKRLLVIPAVCGLVEVTRDIGPPNSGWGVMGSVT
jgi:hypothetical protein